MSRPVGDHDIHASAAWYTPLLLRFIYNFWVLNISNTFAWRCPTKRVQVPFFNRLVSPRHVDIGVGTGYYLTHAPLQPNALLTLVDLNPNSLSSASAAVQHSHPEVKYEMVQADVLASQPLPILAQSVSSISVMYLLHCLPGPPARKAALLARLGNFLTQDGVLFGTTILGDTAAHNWFGRTLMFLYNRRFKAFDNADDSAEDFVGPLKETFKDVKWRVEGVVLLFEARGPRA